MMISSKNVTALRVAVDSQPMTKTSLAARPARPGDLVSLNPQPLPPKELPANVRGLALSQDQFVAPIVRAGLADFNSPVSAQNAPARTVVPAKSDARSTTTSMSRAKASVPSSQTPELDQLKSRMSLQLVEANDGAQREQEARRKAKEAMDRLRGTPENRASTATNNSPPPAVEPTNKTRTETVKNCIARQKAGES
jgi:hypothetical protein